MLCAEIPVIIIIIIIIIITAILVTIFANMFTLSAYVPRTVNDQF